MSRWRERAGRDVAHPSDVTRVVRSVRASLRAARAVESLLLFVAGALGVQAAALCSGAGSTSLALALFVGALAALAWWLEQRVDPGDVARALDLRLRHHGALLTAYDLEGRDGELSSMEELVRVRVLARLRAGEAVRALLPSLVVPIGAPLAAGLILLLVLEGRHAVEPAAIDPRRLVTGLEEALAGVSGDANDGEGLSLAPRRASLEEQARGLLAPTSRASEQAPDPRAIEALDRRLAALESRAEAAGEPSARLAEARTWLDALRMRSEAARAAGDGSGPGTGTRALTGAAPLGTISGSIHAPEMPASAPPNPETPPAPPGTSALGAGAGSWWPREYDAIVARWVELVREGDDPR